MRAIKHLSFSLKRTGTTGATGAFAQALSAGPLRCPGYEFDGIDLSGSENKLEELHRF